MIVLLTNDDDDDVNKRFTRILFHCSVAYKPRTSMTAAAAAS